MKIIHRCALLMGLLLFAGGVVGCEDTPAATPADGSVSMDQGITPDHPLSTPDTGVPDSPGPMANVYLQSPTEDNKTTTQVMLQHLTDPEGKLTGTYADVWNCLQEEGGPKIDINLGTQSLSGVLCTQQQTAIFEPGQGYLHITPPASDTDGSDAFAEIMVYFHITTIHDHYSDTFGIDHISQKPLYAIVNLQGYADLFGMWVGLPNAMYVPPESAGMLEEMLGVDFLEGREAIIFGYNNIPLIPMEMIDFSYDGSVIYHEYTHYAIGGDRLLQPAPDAHGLNPTPIALNEGLADYLPSSFLDNPILGSYALGDGARDLTRNFSCPDHLAGESHYDGEVASGALWAARGVAGGAVLDQAVWDALLTFSVATTYEQAFSAILDEVQQVAPEHAAAIEAIFKERGVLGCLRLKDHQDLDTDLAGSFPIYYAGTATAPLIFTGGVPGYMQFRLPILATTQEIVIEYAAVDQDITGMGSGAKGDVSIALKTGSDPITYDYTADSASSDASAVLQGQDIGEDGYRLVLSGSCIAEGDLIYQFINNGLAPGQVMRVKVTQTEVVTNPSPNFDCP